MEEKETGKRLEKKPEQKKKIAAIAAGAVAGVLVLGYVGLCAVAARDVLLPNSTALGVDLSGMSRTQAEQALTERLQELSQTKNIEFYEPASETRVGLNAAGLVEGGALALEEGETGRNFFTGGARYLHSLFSETELPGEITFTTEGERQIESALAKIAKAAGADSNSTTYELTDTALLFQKGITGTAVDVEDAKDKVRQALTQAGQDTVEVALIQAPPAEPNFTLIHDEVYVQAADAYLDPDSKEIVEAVVGKDFDVEAARAALERTEDGGLCRIELILTEPAVTTEKLTADLFRDVLGEAVTKVTGTSVRIKNVGVAASFVNGKILFPGEEFSFNQVCSPYSMSNGYGKATAYVNGLSKDTVAGGICQASSTLYWAMLKANLETVERWAHRYEPSYIKGGLDATVYGGYGESGSLDFRFINNTDHPIKLEGYVDSKNYLHMTIYGTNTSGIHGEPYSTNRVVTQYAQTVYEADSSIPAGTTRKDSERTAYNAVNIDTYQQLVDDSGNVVSTQYLYRSSYKVRNAVILYNPGDTALWGIDPSTGLKTMAPITPPPEGSEVPVETTAPIESRIPAESQAPVETPPAAETGASPPPVTDLPVQTQGPEHSNEPQLPPGI